MGGILKQLLEWIYYSRCCCCHSPSSHTVCSSCLGKIKINNSRPLKIVEDIPVYSLGKYDKELKTLIRKLKYSGKTSIATTISGLIHKYWLAMPLYTKSATVVPIPLHFTRKLKRGYNQSELIAKAFAEMSGYRLNLRLLKRPVRTKPLYNLSKEQRQKEMSGVFKCDPKHYSGEPVIIIDDICTSGTTLREAIKELKRQNVECLCAIVIANP